MRYVLPFLIASALAYAASPGSAQEINLQLKSAEPLFLFGALVPDPAAQAGADSKIEFEMLVSGGKDVSQLSVVSGNKKCHCVQVAPGRWACLDCRDLGFPVQLSPIIVDVSSAPATTGGKPSLSLSIRPLVAEVQSPAATYQLIAPE